MNDWVQHGDSNSQNRTIELKATKSGWVGTNPTTIEGTKNPTLHPKPNATYELIWTNHDGRHHKLIIVDSDENKMKMTNVGGKKGARRTVGFSAVPKMVAYHDKHHPKTMRGKIEMKSK